MSVNIVQPFLTFRVFSLADKGKKGNRVGFIVHFKTLQDSSAPESLEQMANCIFRLQKISFPNDLDQPSPQNRFDGTNDYSCPQAAGTALDSIYVCHG